MVQADEHAAREQVLRRTWYSHDARWFMAVAAECGFAGANRLNREVIREVGRLEATRLCAAQALKPPANLAAFLAILEEGRDWFVPDELIAMQIEQEDERSYRVDVTRCFVAENIARAGVAAKYECGVFDRIAGWHEALGLPLDGMPPVQTCALAADRPCTRRLAVAPAGEARQRSGPA
ncbi:MAG: hypothetical protein IT304_08880 [Dehalococcoidia bacterium]|nr:hypothetical protein [Dehalococcoidia bacterium]